MHSAILFYGLITALACFGRWRHPRMLSSFRLSGQVRVRRQAREVRLMFSRANSQILSEQWGQPIIIEIGRCRRGGRHGRRREIRADGYTLLVTYAGSRRSMQPLSSFPSTRSRIFKLLQHSPSLIRSHRHPSFRPTTCGVHCAGEGQTGALTYASSGNGFSQPPSRRMAQGEAGISMRTFLQRRGSCYYGCHWRTSRRGVQ